MTYIARLVTIAYYENITDEIRPFVEFQAAHKKVDLNERTKLAILQVENIPSYHVIFLDSGVTFDEIVAELEKQQLTMGEDTKRSIKQALTES
jgi:hypothetical protein